MIICLMPVFLLAYLLHKDRAYVSSVHSCPPHLEQRFPYHMPLEESIRGKLSNCTLSESCELTHFYQTPGLHPQPAV